MINSVQDFLGSDEDYREQYRKVNAALIEIGSVNIQVANMLKDVLFSSYRLLGFQEGRAILTKNGVGREYQETFTQLVDFTLRLERELEKVSEVEREYEIFKSHFFPMLPATNENYYFIKQLLIKLGYKKS